MSLRLTLLAAVACIAAWIVLAFALPSLPGVVQLPLAVGIILLVRWWALRE